MLTILEKNKMVIILNSQQKPMEGQIYDKKLRFVRWFKRRVSKYNLYVILYKLDGLTVEQAKQLEHFPCKNKILLTAEKLPEISWAYYIKPNERQQYASAYLGRDVFGKRWFEKKWDFVDFLNN